MWDYPHGDDEYSPFYEGDNIKVVKIDDGVTGIGEFAFFNCSGLTEIDIPDSVTSIRDNVFDGCDYDKLTIYANYGSNAEEYAKNHGDHGIRFHGHEYGAG